MRRRVAITGIGAVTAIGSGAAGLWDGIRRGESAARRITAFDASIFRSQVAAEVPVIDADRFVDGRSLRRLDRFARLGLVASYLALQDARLDLSALDPSRAGVSIGSALGGVAYAEHRHTEFMREGPRSIPSALAFAVYGGASGANVAIQLGLRGPSLANSSSCASGAVAIGDAMQLIRSGDVDIMLAGGAEAPLAPLTYGAFSIIHAMSTRNDDPAHACRPFDAARDGFVMGEGSAILVLEEGQRAERRGAHIYAEIVGYGRSTDAYHMTAPRPDGEDAARAICQALQDGGVSPAAVGYVNAHATGTPLGDAAEACALCRALGPRGASVPVSSTKPLYGHALGASGAIEAAVTALALEHGYLPGTANLDDQDVSCPLTILRDNTPDRVSLAISTSFGFGGVNAALVLAG